MPIGNSNKSKKRSVRIRSRTLINVSRKPLNFRASVHKQPRERRSGLVSTDLKGGNYADKAGVSRLKGQDKPKGNGKTGEWIASIRRQPLYPASSCQSIDLDDGSTLLSQGSSKNSPYRSRYLAARDLPRVQNRHASRTVFFFLKLRVLWYDGGERTGKYDGYVRGGYKFREIKTEETEDVKIERTFEPGQFHIFATKLAHSCVYCFSFNYSLINNFSAISLQRIIYLNKNFNWIYTKI